MSTDQKYTEKQKYTVTKVHWALTAPAKAAQ